MTNSFGYKEYIEIFESLDTDIGSVKRDTGMEFVARYMVPDESKDSLKVLYTKPMDDSNLRVIKFKNPQGRIEYHVHNNSVMPGTKSDNESKLGFIHAVKLIHNDAKDELESGNDVHLQSVTGSPHNNKFRAIANRLASKSGKQVVEAGEHPITTAPFLKGPVLLIKS